MASEDPPRRLRPPAPPALVEARPAPEPVTLDPDDAALVAEACNRSDVVWLRPAGHERAHATWHVWHQGAICVVHGGEEQQVPIPGGRVEVLVRSKDAGSMLLQFTAQATSPTPGSEQWQSAASVIALKRLNALDPQTLLERWAAASVITLLHPTAPLRVGGGDDATPAGSMAPPRGPGTTVTRRPFHLGGRARRRDRQG